MTNEQIANLQARTEGGDGEAAWRLASYYGFNRRDLNAFLLWERRSARLGCSAAQDSLAARIELNQVEDYAEFGSSREQAVRALLERAAQDAASACNHLARLHKSGYFGRVDVTNAIHYYRRGADLGSSDSAGWLAELLPLTNASNRMEEAYFWCALSTMYAHPESVGGRERWDLRLKLSSQLDLGTLERAWTKIDQDIAEVRSGRRKLDPPLYNFGSSDEDAERVYREGVKAVDEKEKGYRSSRRRGAAGSGL